MDVACFCGCRFSSASDIGTCPDCGQHTTLTGRVSDPEKKQIRRLKPRSEPGHAAADRLSITTGAKSTPERPSTVFVELNQRTSDGFTVSLDWDRDTGQTQIVIHDARTATQTVFGVPGAHAADAFRHPFRYAP